MRELRDLKDLTIHDVQPGGESIRTDEEPPKALFVNRRLMLNRERCETSFFKKRNHLSLIGLN